MSLHLFVAGKRLASYPVTPDNVQAGLIEIGKHIETFREHGRVAVTLDSFDHSNVTWLISSHAPANRPVQIPEWDAS